MPRCSHCKVPISHGHGRRHLRSQWHRDFEKIKAWLLVDKLSYAAVARKLSPARTRAFIRKYALLSGITA